MRQLRNATPEHFDYAAGLGSGGCCDIDAIWERRGHFLIIENKQPGESVSGGQQIMLTALSKLPYFTVWEVRGYPPDDIISRGIFGGSQQPCNRDELRAAIQRWWDAHSTVAPAPAPDWSAADSGFYSYS